MSFVLTESTHLQRHCGCLGMIDGRWILASHLNQTREDRNHISLPNDGFLGTPCLSTSFPSHAPRFRFFFVPPHPVLLLSMYHFFAYMRTHKTRAPHINRRKDTRDINKHARTRSSMHPVGKGEDALTTRKALLLLSGFFSIIGHLCQGCLFLIFDFFCYA